MPTLSSKSIQLIGRSLNETVQTRYTDASPKEEQKSSYYCDQYGVCNYRKRHRHLGFLGFLGFIVIPIALLLWFCCRKVKRRRGNATTTTYNEAQTENFNQGNMPSEGYYDQNGNFVSNNTTNQHNNVGAGGAGGYYNSGRTGTKSSTDSSNLNQHGEKNYYSKPNTNSTDAYNGGNPSSYVDKNVNDLQYQQPAATQDPSHISSSRAQDYYNTPVNTQGYYKS